MLEWAAERDTFDQPASLDHGDLHDRQIFAAREGRHRFFDWGDASIAHPFATLRVTVDITVENYGTESSAISKLVDAFLSPWDGGHDELRRAARLAYRLAPLARARSWTRIFPGTGRFDPTNSLRAALLHLLDDPPF